jgi:hypothetical protein
MISEGWQHSLSFTIRFNNHFTSEPVGDELPVRLDHTFTRPVVAPEGGYRQADGSYRFINLEAGMHRVRWLPPLEESYRSWVSWEDDPQIQVPNPDPAELITRDLWPEATAAIAPGTTAIRGRLIGTNNASLRIRISHSSFPSTRFTFSDDVGEFLFPLYEPLQTNAAGRLELNIEIADGARSVTGGEFVPAGSAASFVGASFEIVPGRSSRVLFRIS